MSRRGRLKTRDCHGEVPALQGFYFEDEEALYRTSSHSGYQCDPDDNQRMAAAASELKAVDDLDEFIDQDHVYEVSDMDALHQNIDMDLCEEATDRIPQYPSELVERSDDSFNVHNKKLPASTSKFLMQSNRFNLTDLAVVHAAPVMDFNSGPKLTIVKPSLVKTVHGVPTSTNVQAGSTNLSTADPATIAVETLRSLVSPSAAIPTRREVVSLSFSDNSKHEDIEATNNHDEEWLPDPIPSKRSRRSKRVESAEPNSSRDNINEPKLSLNETLKLAAISKKREEGQTLSSGSEGPSSDGPESSSGFVRCNPSQHSTQNSSPSNCNEELVSQTEASNSEYDNSPSVIVSINNEGEFDVCRTGRLRRNAKLLQSMFHSQTGTDMTLTCSDGNIKCHKAAIFPYSSHLSNLFKQYPDSEQIEYDLGDVMSPTLRQLMRLCYYGNIRNVTEEGLCTLSVVGKKLGIKGFHKFSVNDEMNELQKEVLSKRLAGASTEECAQIFKISKRSVRRIAEKTLQDKKTEIKQKVITQRLSGTSSVETAKMFNISKGAVNVYTRQGREVQKKEFQKELISKKLTGVSTKKCSEVFKMSTATVLKISRKALKENRAALIQKVIAKRQSGTSTNDIAKMFKISIGTVDRWTMAARQDAREEVKKKVIAERTAGMSQVNLMKKYNICMETLKQWTAKATTVDGSQEIVQEKAKNTLKENRTALIQKVIAEIQSGTSADDTAKMFKISKTSVNVWTAQARRAQSKKFQDHLISKRLSGVSTNEGANDFKISNDIVQEMKGKTLKEQRIDLKQKVITERVRGTSSKEIAKSFGISKTTVDEWTADARADRMKQLQKEVLSKRSAGVSIENCAKMLKITKQKVQKMSQKTLDDQQQELKQKVVAERLSGTSAVDIAKTFKISKGAVYLWTKQARQAQKEQQKQQVSAARTVVTSQIGVTRKQGETERESITNETVDCSKESDASPVVIQEMEANDIGNHPKLVLVSYVGNENSAESE